ncbi:hypothetical protein [Pseudoxanthomonas indica]|uniref:Uncharacterized protein n=1 Tax=Pseudoxanthomonas indica TaxID=428993 RepID=A0A1T5JZZ9_9GAMM|nr:hypothetical protein [Pseudoxanthomonas indica]GGD45635.1 hypothetical protein GCM10007235_16940 [Pseudoxanthomonas indica]SKC56966.1 hypothetical protein SAMN06296058_1235 [Pseudoxanthomonas indica]
MRPDLFDADDWEHFLKGITSIREEALAGDKLLERLEHAWAPLFEGHDEDVCGEIYKEVMATLLREGVVPPDWSALTK